MSTGRIISNQSGVKAREPKVVIVSDGTHKFPFGHPDYWSGYKPDGMLLLDLNRDEYSEFRVNTDRDFKITLYQAEGGSRYKLFIYRTTADPINITFDGEVQVYALKGAEGEETFTILDIEVVELGGQLVNRIGPTVESIQDLVDSLNTSSIRLSEDITFNGASQGAYANGSTIAKGTLLTNILRNFAQVAQPVTYVAPTMSLSPSNQSVEVGTTVTPTLTPGFTQKDAGAVNRYLLTKTQGGAQSTILDDAILSSTTPQGVQMQDGAYLKYTATIYYDEGPTKVNNMGEEDPTGKIMAGSLSKTTTYTGIRKAFYAADTGNANPAISDEIRALSGTKDSPANGTTLSINIPAGATRVIFAYPDTLRDVSSVKYVELGNAEVGDTFSKLNFNVEGANGFGAIGYKVYVYIPAAPYSGTATYNVTI